MGLQSGYEGPDTQQMLLESITITGPAIIASEPDRVGKGQREHCVQVSVKYSSLTAPGASVLHLTSSKMGREGSRKKIKTFY